MAIIRVSDRNAGMWAELCHELWPHNSAEEMLDEFNRGELPNEYLYLLNEEPIAFLSLSIRTDYVEGKTDPGPVGYVEAIYVRPPYRKRGIAQELVTFAQRWAAEQGCTMLASDCELSNADSRLFHSKVGFEEASVNVHFVMHLTTQA